MPTLPPSVTASNVFGVNRMTPNTFERDGLERVRGHPVVVGVDVTHVDLLAIAGEPRVVLVAQRAPCFAGNVVSLLVRLQEQRAVPVVRRVQRRRAVERRSHRERVEQPARAVAEPAAGSQRLVVGVVGLVAVEVKGAQMKDHVRVAQERRQILGFLLELREESIDDRCQGRRRGVVGPGRARPSERGGDHDGDDTGCVFQRHPPCVLGMLVMRRARANRTLGRCDQSWDEARMPRQGAWPPSWSVTRQISRATMLRRSSAMTPSTLTRSPARSPRCAAWSACRRSTATLPPPVMTCILVAATHCTWPSILTRSCASGAVTASVSRTTKTSTPAADLR